MSTVDSSLKETHVKDSRMVAGAGYGLFITKEVNGVFNC